MRILLVLVILAGFLRAAEPSLKISVYATAGGIQQRLASPDAIAKAAIKLKQLGISRIILEGRRGDEYVSPERLVEVRTAFAQHGIRATGGIATVPGKTFSVRQDTFLGWLNWEAKETQKGIADYFHSNAKVFDELVVDDFFCTADTSPISQEARGNRDWGQYRRDLLSSLTKPLFIQPARAVKPGVRMVIKYPQWYDLFHLYGYDPQRTAPEFDAVWVGTEVRNPKTQRMGFVQPTEGYINYRWLNTVTGGKAEAAWFDHIECTAQNFVDQAWQSVLAGSPELILFNLFDVLDGHPGHALLQQALPQMQQVSRRIRGRELEGVAFYKPVNSDPGDNRYLMDYLAMLGIPIVPVADYPAHSKSVILGVQAAHDPNLIDKVKAHLKTGARIAMTASLMERVKVPEGVVRLDLRTFSDQDFLDVNEWLLAPKELPWMQMSTAEANALRRSVGVDLNGPTEVAYYRFGADEAFYNFRNQPVEMQLRGATVTVPANGFVWLKP